MWSLLGLYFCISEEFIIEFKNEIDWGCISRYQKLSCKFINKYKNKLYTNFLIDNKNINKNYELSKILHIDICLNDEINNIKKYKDISIFF